MALKTIWDYYIGWTTTDPQFYHEVYLDPQLTRMMSGVISRTVVDAGADDEAVRRLGPAHRHDQLHLRVHRLHRGSADAEGSPRAEPAAEERRLPRAARPTSATPSIASRSSRTSSSSSRCATSCPRRCRCLAASPWINTEAISLDPERWEQDGLFLPKTAPRDYRRHQHEIARLFTIEGRGRAQRPGRPRSMSGQPTSGSMVNGGSSDYQRGQVRTDLASSR